MTWVGSANWRPLVAMGAVAAIGLALGSPTIALAGPLVVVGLAINHRQHVGRVADEAALAQLPVTVDRLVSQLRAGHSLSQSCLGLGRPGPGQAGPAVQPLVVGLEAGVPLVDAAGRLTISPERPVRLLGVALIVLARHGGPAVPALQRLRLTLIGVVHDRQRAAAEAAQARASAAMLVAAPSLFSAVVATLDPGIARLYLQEMVGTACVTVSVGLSLLGWLWMQRLVDRSNGRVSNGRVSNGRVSNGRVSNSRVPNSRVPNSDVSAGGGQGRWS